MKILVPVKRVVDYNVKVRVKSDGTGVETANVKMSMNPFDEIAVEEAVRLKEAGSRPRSSRCPAASPRARRRCAPRSRSAPIARSWSRPTPNCSRSAVAKLLQGGRRQGAAQARASWASRRSTTTPTRPARCSPRCSAGRRRRSPRRSNRRRTRRRSRARSTAVWRTIEIKLPAVVTTDLRLNEPRYATLPNIMKAKKKPLETLTPGALGVDVAPRLKTLKVDEPPKRKGGGGRRRQGAGRQAAQRSEGMTRRSRTLDLTHDPRICHASLVIAEHDNASLKAATLQHRHRRAEDRRRHPRAGRRQRRRRRPPQAAAAIAGVDEGAARRCAALAQRHRRERRALIVALVARPAATRHRARPGHRFGKNVAAARRRAARRRADFRDHRASRVARHVRAADLCRQRAGDGADRRIAIKVITVRTTGFDAAPATGGSAAVEAVAPRRGHRPVARRRPGAHASRDRPELTAARIVVSGGRGTGSGENFKMLEAARRQARRGDRRLARRGRRRLRAQRLPGRPDRQDRRAGALHRGRHLRRDPASRRHEGQQGHRRDQQGRRSADLPGRRLRPRRRSVPGRAGADRRAR